MKTLSRVVVLITLVVSLFGFIGSELAQALPLTSGTPLLAALNAVDAKLTTEFGQKIDLNNSDIRDFRDLRGFYPNLASKIIKNAPYEKVEDVLNIPGLSETQQARLQANLDNFVVTEVSSELTEGDDRINPGVY
ncbi:photosystem II complex extrinsic protein PsbU [Synechocystis sp. LKSZ1]|uniref:photosystem II complex extrinsic protein PsbU n=1 Tax=Synechocystis sp. LKSZ1 TaxID=3144951 RepID=UPI00336C06F3